MPLRRVWSDKRKRRARSRFHLICIARFWAIFILAMCLVGCSERSQQLEERFTELEKELNRTQDELRSTKQALDASNAEVTRLKAAANSASATVPPSSRVAEAKPSASVAQNQSAPAQRPATSSLPADRSVTIQWPGSGPSASANQPAIQNAPAPAPGNAAANAPVIVPQRAGTTGTGGAGNRTVVIQWPNNNAAAPSANQPSAPSGAANPPVRPVQQPAQNSTGRSDRTVIIQWPGSGQSPSP